MTLENRYKIDYDIKQRCVTSAKFKQGDVDSSVLEVTLFDNGQPIDITGETIEFRFLKSDKTFVFQDETAGVNIIDAANGGVECILKSNTLAAIGVVRTEIRRKKDNVYLTTPTFNFVVESSIGGVALSSNYIASIENKMVEWQLNEKLRQEIFTGNEQTRIANFNSKEYSRQATFNSNEQNRENNFNSNEQIRQNEFEANEVSRESSMDDIENRFNILTTTQQQDAEVINARTSSEKGKTFSSLDSRLEEIEKDTPKVSNTDLNKKYTYKLQVNNGQPQLILEEVS